MNKKLKKFGLAFVPAVMVLGSTVGVLSSCKKTTSNLVDVKLVNDDNFRLTNTTASIGGIFNTTIELINPEVDKFLILNYVYVFSDGNELVRGDEIDGDYQFEIASDRKTANLVVYNPKATIYVAVDTSLYENDISFNTSDKVNVHANESLEQLDGKDYFIFNFNNVKQPDELTINTATIESVEPDQGFDPTFFDRYLCIENGSFLIDPYTNTFKIGIYCPHKAVDVPDEYWSGKVSFKFSYTINGKSQTRYLHNIPVSYTNNSNYEVEMNAENAVVEIYKDTDVAKYTMKLNDDSMPFGGYVNVRLNKNQEESEEDLGKFYLINSLVPVIENANGDKTFTVSIAYRLDSDKTFNKAQKLAFDFEVSYIDSSYQPITETAKYKGKNGNPNELDLKKLDRTVAKYLSTSQYVSSPLEPAIFEFECVDYSPVDPEDLTIELYEINEDGSISDYVSQKLTANPNNLDISVTPDDKIILRVPVEVLGQDPVYNYTFCLKIKGFDQTSEGQQAFTVHWVNGLKKTGEPDPEGEYSFPLYYTLSKSILPTDFAFDGNQITGLAPSGLQKLSTTPLDFDSIAIPAEINGVKVHAIADGAFKYTSDSGKALLNWGKKRFAEGKPLPRLVFTTPSNDLVWRLTRIGISAFEGQNYFTGELIIPWSVLSIDNYAFKDCSVITSDKEKTGFTGLQFGTYDVHYTRDEQKWAVEFDVHSRLNWIGKEAFTCTKGASFSAFRGNLILPNTLASLGNSCFKNTGFDGVLHFSSSYSWHEMSDSAFEGCIHLRGVCQQDFSPNESSTYASIPKSFFKNCSSFSGTYSVIYDDKVIGNKRWVPSNEIVIDGTIQSIGESAFEATAIQKLTIKSKANNGTVVVNSHAFYLCAQLSDITIFTSKDQDFEADDWDSNAFDKVGTNTTNNVIFIDSVDKDSGTGKILDPETYQFYLGAGLDLYDKYMKSGKLGEFEWKYVEYGGPTPSTMFQNKW